MHLTLEVTLRQLIGYGKHLQGILPIPLCACIGPLLLALGDPYLTYNPGAGAQCEGEQWRSEIAYFHVGTTHIYYRQMESLAPRWLKPSFELYCQFLFRKLQLYTALAAQAGRCGDAQLCFCDFGVVVYNVGQVIYGAC